MAGNRSGVRAFYSCGGAAPTFSALLVRRVFMYGLRPCRLAPVGTVLVLLLLALTSTAVGAATPYPPNTTISTYFDARFCGNGQVSVVTDQDGNLIDVCSATGQRINPAAYAAPGYNYGYAPGYGAGLPGYSAGFVPPAYGGIGNAPIIRQYTDGNSNCPNGDVTETTAGFFCTENGQPAVSSLSIPIYNGGFVPTATNGFVPTYTTGGVSTINYGTATGYNGGGAIRQYNDGRSNCPNGDVTETLSGFYCTANGQPAFRVN
jgi:hypothetical protein